VVQMHNSRGAQYEMKDCVERRDGGVFGDARKEPGRVVHSVEVARVRASDAPKYEVSVCSTSVTGNPMPAKKDSDIEQCPGL
jgi:hypothetical protein